MLKPLSNHLAVQMTAQGKLLGQPVTCLAAPGPLTALLPAAALEPG